MRDEEEGLLALTAGAAAAAMRRGEVKAVDYVAALLSRISAFEALGAFVALDAEQVLSAAAQADAARKAGRRLGALHGVPLAVKDNIDVAGLPAAAGTPSLRGHLPAADAAVVATLKAEGAIVLGKTNMHELAAGVTTDNAAFGPARNPYDPSRSPGGSSGGTAVAVAARLAPLGLGTDTGGSNRLPPAHCGVIGFRPTVQRWPQRGLIFNSPTRDTIGPMARRMEDIILVDRVVMSSRGTPDRLAPETLRLGVPRAPFWTDLDPQVAGVAEACLARLAAAGVTLIDADLTEVMALADEAGVPIAVGEHAVALDGYLGRAGSPLSSADVFAAVASPDVRAFLAHHDVCAHDYLHAMTVARPALQAAYQAYFDAHRLDGMVFPTAPIAAPPQGGGERIEHNGRTHSLLWLSVRNTNPSSVAGLPGLGLPAGLTAGGQPVGLEVDARFGDDLRLLGMGLALERILPGVPAPRP